MDLGFGERMPISEEVDLGDAPTRPNVTGYLILKIHEVF